MRTLGFVGKFATLAVAMAVAVGAETARAATKTWRGTKNALASNAANWEEGAIPAEGDDIVFDATSAAKPMTWDLDDVTVGSWTQSADYTGIVTFQTGLSRKMGGTAYTAKGVLDEDGVTRVLKVTGNVVLNGGTWTHTAQPNIALSATEPAYIDAKGIYRLVARVGGSFTLGEGATIDVCACGFNNGGPGSGGYAGACGHGGSNGPYETSSGWSDVAGRCYGSTKAPVSLGSGRANSVAGGGSVELKIAGALTLNGSISANAYNTHYAASGGSVYIIADSISGSGSVSAAGGGGGSNYNPGGGGRVAVKLTGEGTTFDNFTGTLSAAGGNADTKQGRAGTVYRERKSDAGEGELFITGNGNSTGYTDWTSTMLTAEDTNHNYRRIVLSNCAVLGVETGVVLKVGTNLEIANPANDRLALWGGSLQVEDGYEFTNMQVRALRPSENASVVFGSDRHAGTTIIGTNCAFYADKELVFDSLQIKSGGKITHIRGDSKYYEVSSARGTSGAEILVRGNMTIDKGGAVDANACGYRHLYGPAPGSGHNYGGSHGGRAYNSPNTMTCYGSITSPFTCGSGGGWNGAGGGRVKMVIIGDLILNGKIDSTAYLGSTFYYGGGAGGSVWITANSLTGSGDISADGGHEVETDAACGGGGRIAVTLTGADSVISDFAGTIHAHGARKRGSGQVRGGAGTVYIRERGAAEDQGTLIVENGNQEKGVTSATDLNTTVTGKEIGSLVVSNGAHLVVREGATLTIAGDIDTRKGYLVTTAAANDLSAAHVELAPSVSPVTYRGTNEFQTVRLHAPGKTVKFGADSIFSVAANGIIEFSGEEDNELTLISADSGNTWPFKLNSGASHTVEYVNAADSDASSGMMVTANYSTDGQGNLNWNFPQIIKGEVITWMGTLSDEWSNAGNWDKERLPVATDVVLIPAGKANYPRQSIASAISHLNIESGAQFNLGGFDFSATSITNRGTIVATAHETIEVSGDFVNEGAITPKFSTVRFTGDKNQAFANGGATYNQVEFAKNGGAITVSGAFTTDRLTATATTTYAIDFASGASVTVRDLKLDGGAKLLALEGVDNASWAISVTGRSVVKGITVRNSNASGGRKIYAGASSQSLGNNENWDFTTEAITWVGGSTGKFSVGDNWSSGEVPGASDRVLVDGAVTITADAEASIGELVLGGGESAANFVSTAPITVAGNVIVATNGSWTCDKGATIGNTLIVDEGGVVTHSTFSTWDKTTYTTTEGLRLTVNGDMIVEVGGKIDANYKGWVTGPGSMKRTNDGGSYGGRTFYQSGESACYGSLTEPTLPGCGGTQRGGGAIEITAGGEMVVNGVVTCVGVTGTHYVGSGGAVWLKCSRFSGEGSISVNGGCTLNSTTHSTGSGGRVAIHQSVATDSSAWLGKITAYGGTDGSGISTDASNSAAGTIYWRHADSGANGGLVIIDNNGGTITKRVGTDMPVSVAGDSDFTYRRLDVIVRNVGIMQLTGDLAINDLYLEKSGRLSLQGHTLTLFSRAHNHRKGWSGTVVEDGGTIVWQGGLMMLVK